MNRLKNLFLQRPCYQRGQFTAGAGYGSSALLALALLLSFLPPARAANVHFKYINPIGGAPLTNSFRIQTISSNILADGTPAQVMGLPMRVTPDSNGDATVTNLQINWYADIDHHVIFQVYDSGPTLYDVTNLWQSGFNLFVVRKYGTNPPPSFNDIVIGLGYFPQPASQALTNVIGNAFNTNSGSSVTGIVQNIANNLPQVGLALTNPAVFDTNGLASASTNNPSLVRTNNPQFSLALTNPAVFDTNGLASASTNNPSLVRTNNPQFSLALTNPAVFDTNGTAANLGINLSNLVSYLNAQIGNNTNFIILTGGTGTDANANGTDVWQNASSWTNLNGISAITNDASGTRIYISGISSIGAIGGYAVGSLWTNINGAGATPTTAFFPRLLLAGANVTKSSAYGAETISASNAGSATNVFFTSGTNTSYRQTGGTNIFDIPPGTFQPASPTLTNIIGNAFNTNSGSSVTGIVQNIANNLPQVSLALTNPAVFDTNGLASASTNNPSLVRTNNPQFSLALTNPAVFDTNGLASASTNNPSLVRTNNPQFSLALTNPAVFDTNGLASASTNNPSLVRTNNPQFSLALTNPAVFDTNGAAALQGAASTNYANTIGQNGSNNLNNFIGTGLVNAATNAYRPLKSIYNPVTIAGLDTNDNFSLKITLGTGLAFSGGSSNILTPYWTPLAGSATNAATATNAPDNYPIASTVSVTNSIATFGISDFYTTNQFLWAQQFSNNPTLNGLYKRINSNMMANLNGAIVFVNSNGDCDFSTNQSAALFRSSGNNMASSSWTIQAGNSPGGITYFTNKPPNFSAADDAHFIQVALAAIGTNFTGITLSNATTSGTFTINGSSGAGSFDLGTISTPGIHPDFGFIQEVGGTNGLLQQSLAGYYWNTLGSFYGADPTLVLYEYLGNWQLNNTIFEHADRNYGASVTTYIQALGGSGAALADLPVNGKEITANQKLPYIVLSTRGYPGTYNTTNCSQTNVLANIVSFLTNGYGILTNSGVRLAADFENGWLDQHRDANGYLVWNINRFPANATSPTNFIYMLHASNFEAFAMCYFTSKNQQTNNTEIDLDPLTIQSGHWQYPNGPNPFTGGIEVEPAITPQSAHQDFTTFYGWGLDGWTGQDDGYANAFASGPEKQMWNTIDAAVVKPYFYNGGNPIYIDVDWQHAYPNTFGQHAIIVNFLIDDPTGNSLGGFPVPLEIENKANGITFGSGGQSTEPNSTGISETMQAIRPWLKSLTNFSAGTVQLFSQTDPLQDMISNWSTNDWKSYIYGCGMFNQNLWLVVPLTGYLTNSYIKQIVTNQYFLSVWLDAKQARAYPVKLDGTNGIFVKPFNYQLNTSKQLAVWFENESKVVSTNLTFNFNSVSFPTNTVCDVFDVFTLTDLGNFTNSYTSTVGTTNCNMVIFTPLGTTANTFFGTIQLNNNLWLTYDPVNNVVRFSSPTQTNSININMSDGSIGIGTISFSGQALTLPISGASTLSFYDKYHIGRSGSDGLLYFNMTQTGADGVGFQENGVTFDTFKTTGNTVTNTVFSGGISTTNISHISSAVTVGASPFNFTNTTPFCEKYRTSGATAYSVSVNGVGVFGSLAGDIGDTLQPGEFLTITYTVAPTLYTNAW